MGATIPRLTMESADESAAFHQAIGWLTGALENAHPGFLDEQAAHSAERLPDVSALFTRWADEVRKVTEKYGR